MVLLLFIVVLAGLLLLPGVQTFLAKKATIYLKENYQIEAKIGRLAIVLPNKIALQQVYIADEHADTLIFAESLDVNYAGYNSKTNTFAATKVVLNNGRLYMRKYPEDSLFNFGYFLEKVSGDGITDSAAVPFRLKMGQVDITNFRYKKERLNCVDSCTQINLRDANIAISNFYLDGDYVSADINSMTFTDTDRFTLHEFSCKAAYQPKYIAARDLHFVTDASKMDGQVVLHYENPDQLDDFLEYVTFEGTFNQSTISSDEFRSYIPEFPQFDTFSINGNFSGPINDFTVTECVIDLGEKTHFFGEVHVQNPSETDLLRVTASVGDLRTNARDIRKYISQFTGEMDWMALVDSFSTINYRGKYNGTVSDFDLNGTLKLDENVVKLNGYLHNVANLSKATYAGTLQAQPIHLGKLLKIPGVGLAAFSTSINGVGLTPNAVTAQLNGSANFVEINGYAFKNWNFNGDVAKKRFDGKLGIKDKNLGFSFDGAVDFASDTLIADFEAMVADANLNGLHLLSDSIALLNFNSNINFSYFKGDWWRGNVQLHDITYASESRFYFYDSLVVSSSNVGNMHRDALRSKIANFNLSGDYNLPDVASAFTQEILGFYPPEKKRMEALPVDFEYELFVNNVQFIQDLFLPELHLEPGTYLHGSYSGQKQFFELHATSNELGWENWRFRDLELDASRQDSTHQIVQKIENARYGNLTIDSVHIAAQTTADSNLFAASGILRDSIDSYIQFAGHAVDSSSENNINYHFILDKGGFNVGYTDFKLRVPNRIGLSKAGAQFENVGFEHENSAIALNGFLGNDPTRILRISTANLNAELINYFVRNNDLVFGGNINGDVIFDKIDRTPRFASDVLVDSMYINNDYVGNLALNSNWDVESGKITIDLDVLRNKLLMLNVSGNLLPDSIGSLDLDFNFNRFRLHWINPFLDGILENIRGVASGTVHLGGNFNAFTTDGTLSLSQANLSIPYFNTDYGLAPETKVLVKTNRIELPKTIITDNYKGTKGSIGGFVSHKNFDDWYFNIGVNSDNILALNTENAPDAYFYGLGYVAGNFDLIGPLNDLNITADITTQKNTEFKIPFSNPLSVSNQNFITYTGNRHYDFIEINPEVIKEEILKPIGGLSIALNVKVTPDALVKLILDETVGDIISGRGTGDLRINIPSDGDMEMFGSVIVNEGDYLFTMQNLINKKFNILPGGRITWTGDPYEASINMQAKYTTRSTLTGFVTNNYDGQRVQIDLLMDLDGPISNPNIKFSLLLPNSNPSYQEELNNRLNDPDKLNQQAFALLVLNSFWLDNTGTESSFVSQSIGGVSSNTMQMAAAQFSNFFAQGLSKYVDLSLGYNSATEQQQSQLEVSVSKPLFNDRFIVNSRVDVPLGTTPTATPGTQTFTGDIEVVYKITADGHLRAKGFYRSNQDNPTLDVLSPYTSGMGVFYTTSFPDLFGKKPEDTTEQGE